MAELIADSTKTWRKRVLINIFESIHKTPNQLLLPKYQRVGRRQLYSDVGVATLAENYRQLNPRGEPLHGIHIPSSSSHTTNILERSKAVGCGTLRTKLNPDEILQSHFADVPEEGRSLDRLALTS